MPDGATESDWQTIGELAVISGKVAILDPSTFEAIDFPLPRGQYAVQVKIVKYPQEQWQRVAGLRGLAAPDDHPPQIDASLGEIAVDAGMIGVVDANALHPDFTEEWDNHNGQIETAWQSAGLHATAQWGDTDDATIFFASAGFGDGTYKVFSVVRNAKCVGFEIEFIAPGSPYPFQQ